ncbi:hypothetical protein [Clostridium sp. C2-6-12]|uniref:hypothetical protein n=1 Tax=Clostridium sp. C2-6-12 TaxID=2698832 RepID=UPI0013696B79|nr:hypothetical protein [Clostridium sp. C2-6-12]
MTKNELIKVILNDKVYYKLNDILKLEELKQLKVKKTEAKGILKPLAIKIAGLGASFWILEEELEKVKILRKTITYEVMDNIRNSVSSASFAIALATAGKQDRLPKDFIKEQKEKAINDAIKAAENKEQRVIEDIDKVITDIEDIEQLNQKIKDYNAEIKYEIIQKWSGFALDCKVIAPNYIRDISTFGKDKYSRNFEILENGDLSYYDSGFEEEIIFKKGQIGEMIWDQSKPFIENKLTLLQDKSRFKLDCSDYEWIGVQSRENNNLDINIDIKTDDIFSLIEDKEIITFSVDDLKKVKEKLLILKEQSQEFIKKLK